MTFNVTIFGFKKQLNETKTDLQKACDIVDLNAFNDSNSLVHTIFKWETKSLLHCIL